MSSERLRLYLLKAGRDEDEIMSWDRDQLLEQWAIEAAKIEEEEEESKASPKSPVETDYELQKRRLEFEMHKYEQEIKERREEKEREELRRREEREERRE